MALPPKTSTAIWQLTSLLMVIPLLVAAQSSEPWPEKPGIYFPQAPPAGVWRKSIGAVFTTTPREITEEIRVNIPAIDFNIQRALSRQVYLTGRVQTQIVQTNASLALRWARPINNRLSVGAGYEIAGWFGALNVSDVFNSQAYGVETFPSLSVGYRLTRDLQLSIRSEAIIDLYYRSKVGSLAVEYNKREINGVAFTFILEQPFYNKRHVSIGIRGAYSNFNWQLWSLYDTFDRNLFYPQLIFGFIL